MAEKLEVNVNLIDDKVKFSGTARNLNPVTFDYNEPLGTGIGYTGLEMLMLSLSACSGTAVAVVLRKMQKKIQSLQVTATGIRNEQLPFALKEINLKFMICSDAGSDEIQKAVTLAEESYCPVWAMLKGSLKIDAGFECRGI